MQARHVAISLITIPVIVAAGEPLPEFEQIVARCEQAHKARPNPEVAYMPTIPSWVKRAYGPLGMAFDVKRTDSLVSPFVAELKLSELVASERADSEVSASALDVNLKGRVAKNDLTILYAWQGGSWRVTGGRTVFTVRIREGESFSPPTPITLTSEQVGARMAKLKGCLGGT